MANKDPEEKKSSKPRRPATCGVQSPGPKYQLRPLTGYPEHCLSKVREPAYTIGKVQKYKPKCGPGPKYNVKMPWDQGYTIPKATYKPPTPCTPGPQYTLPGFSAPAYTIVFKPKERCPEPLSGPYPAPPNPYTPSYTFGGKAKERICEYNPPLRDVGNTDLVRPANPKFTIVGRHPMPVQCIGPGPKYYPKNLKKSPEYTFGVKYSPCVALPRTPCDELC